MKKQQVHRAKWLREEICRIEGLKQALEFELKDIQEHCNHDGPMAMGSLFQRCSDCGFEREVLPDGVKA